jgi:hypothetical protein
MPIYAGWKTRRQSSSIASTASRRRDRRAPLAQALHPEHDAAGCRGSSGVSADNARSAADRLSHDDRRAAVQGRSIINLLFARGAYRAVARLYPEDLIELRQGARVIEGSR